MVKNEIREGVEAVSFGVLEPLSDDERYKCKIIKELFENYTRTHVLSDETYGKIFDKWYEMKLTQLILISETLKHI